VFPDDGDPFFRGLQAVYDEIGEGLPSDAHFPRPGELRDYAPEITASGLFDVVHVRHFDWERRYDAEQYIALLKTFSGHIAMAGWQRERLFGAIRAGLAERPDGTLRRHWAPCCTSHAGGSAPAGGGRRAGLSGAGCTASPGVRRPAAGCAGAGK